MIIGPARCLRTTYKLTYVQTTHESVFTVAVYPPSPSTITTASYRFDVLPEWTKHYVRMMDVAGSNHAIDSVGRKIGDTYWIEAQVDTDKIVE